MALDITLIILFEKSGGGYVSGEIFRALKTADVPEPPAPGTKFVHIHITDVPAAGVQKLKALLRPHDTIEQQELIIQAWQIASELGGIANWYRGLEREPFLSQPTLKPGTDNILVGDVLVRHARREWVIQLADIPAGKMAQLRANREITVTWPNAKAFVKSSALNRTIVDADLA